MKGLDLADGQLMALPRVPDVEANGDLRARADEGSGIAPELLAGLRQAVERARSRPGADQRALLGRAEDPDGGQDTGTRRDDDAGDAERLGEAARVQRSGAAEGD